uniref:Replication protein A 70 kDa DNA-binding subunit B-like n=1 Tax=Nicotiana sylvestris TaxID=4096 RepID=A0A1U7UPX7_NICSY|nr:PREDICTED: replication protein A 70 kDa DNA-binding subunit B-like [Nicotiana sylvestris]
MKHEKAKNGTNETVTHETTGRIVTDLIVYVCAYVLAIVINGGPSTYAANGRRIQEFIIMDNQKKPTKFTLWEDFIDLYGNKLLKQLNEYPVILARKIGKSLSGGSSNKFNGLSSKFSTTIQFNPPYPQATELKSWYYAFISF